MILTLILIVLALIHFYWALGGKYGLDRALPTDVNGKRLLNPSTFMTYIMGVILLSFAYVAFELYKDDTSLWITSVSWVLTILFFLRAIGDFNVVGIFKKVKNTAFAKYDTLIYISLCLFISILFIKALM